MRKSSNDVCGAKHRKYPSRKVAGELPPILHDDMVLPPPQAALFLARIIHCELGYELMSGDEVVDLA